MENEKRGRNWRAKYLTKVDFEAWKGNDFWHLRQRVDQLTWLSLTILAVLIGTLVVRFLLG